MRKYAALAAIAVVALSGCTSAAAAPAPTVAAPTVTTPQIESTNIYRAIHAGWKGDDAPSKPWMDDAALLVCKQLIGGIEPRVMPGVEGENWLSDGNNRVVVLAAQKFVCDESR